FLEAALPMLREHRRTTLPVVVLNSDGSVAADKLRRSLASAAREWRIPVVTDFAGAIRILSTLNDHEARVIQAGAASNTV
ncbi:MAG TPA: hypothetical protein H9830_07420, partial [Candidatus Agrococcus pullicola]|nr:hypothetical protein [Candidatus Agrococcus pullicola]